ncbi:MAG: hypothetical protein CM15mP74_04800 [Halieaceae bacterium]|nr:MAG: hypothetical protein CM15mP74_04800 [Halieaceae bacterium]
MSAACAGMSPLAKLGHEQGGLEGIRRMRALDDVLKQDGELEALAHSLGRFIASWPRAARRLSAPLLIKPNLAAASDAAWAAAHAVAPANLRRPARPVREARQEMWVTNTQVNFCAKATPPCPPVIPTRRCYQYWRPSCAMVFCIAAFANKAEPMVAVRATTLTSRIPVFLLSGPQTGRNIDRL